MSGLPAALDKKRGGKPAPAFPLLHPTIKVILCAGGTILLRDHETTTVSRINKINLLPLQKGAQTLFCKQLNTIHTHFVVIITRLIQSQPQSGASSTKTLKHHPQHFVGVLSQDRLQSTLCLICNFHNITPFTISIYLYISKEVKDCQFFYVQEKRDIPIPTVVSPVKSS